jgi:uncharacterized protein with LGFP repeats
VRSLTAALAAALVLLPAAPARAANGAPVVVDDAVNLRSTAMTQWVTPLDNDSDPDGDRLTYTAVTSGTKGTVSVDSRFPTYLNYRPYPGTGAGTDSFTYTVSDGNGNTTTGTVTVTLWDDAAVPADLTISSAGSDAVTLSWAAAARATSYRVHGIGGSVLTTTDLTFTASGLRDATSYTWHVAAVNGGGFESSWSNAVFRNQRLSTPTYVKVDVTGPTSVSVDWDDSGESGPWTVYRDGALLTSTTVSRYEDTGLVTGRAYSYQVQRTFPAEPTYIYPPSALSAPVTATPVELTPIDRLFLDLGGAGGDLGPVTVPERAIPGGRQQDHSRGIIVQQDGGDPFSVTRTFVTAYLGLGGASGELGFPRTHMECDLRDSGCAQLFEAGSIWSSSSTPTRVVRQIIEDGWAAAGWEDGWLGYPIGDQTALPGGLWQAFEDGGVYWSAATGSHGVSGPIGDLYASAGGPAGGLRYPTTDEHCDSVGCSQSFQGGSVYWSPATGTRRVFGAIGETYARHGGATGGLGYPITGEICGLRGGGCYQLFQGGSIYWSPATGAQRVIGGIRDTWARHGLENGGLGYPVTGETCGLRSGGCYQLFQGGSIYWSAAGGAHRVFGAIREIWARHGLENGGLGYPTTDEICGLRGGGCYQLFQGGAVYWSPATGAQRVIGGIGATWARYGGANGGLGYPVTGESCGLRGGGCYQLFQGGSIYWSPATGAHVVLGAIRDAWARQGLENGRLGYPTSDEKFFGSYLQEFQGGKITYIGGRAQIVYR